MLLVFLLTHNSVDKSKIRNMANYSQVTALSFVPTATVKDHRCLSLIQLLHGAPYHTALRPSSPVLGSVPH